ncbi:aldolase/citrate lyase family protein [Mesorhizobium sp. A623]
MDLIYIANRAAHVEAADTAGVDRIMVDLEILGKQERQGHLDTLISSHSLDDIDFVRRRLTRSSLMVRINPIHDGSAAEIDAVVARGAEIVMLPMFMTAEEVQTFASLLNGRARLSLLLETAQALGRAGQILSVPGIDEVHIGLNDLHLALGLDFMFEVLAGGLIDHLAGLCRARRIKFGFGGIARLGRGLLPADDILLEHARLGSSQVILSRDFHALFDDRPLHVIKADFAEAVNRVRATYDRGQRATQDELTRNRAEVGTKIAQIVAARRQKS